jgi:FkbM family methyltransferase
VSEKIVILGDTALLCARVLLRRTRRLGLGGLFRVRKAPPAVQVLYFDLGTHKQARELAFMVEVVLPRVASRIEAYGFEASPKFFEHAQKQFAGRTNVRLFNKAVVHRVPEGGKVTLYEPSGEGLAASLYRTNYRGQEEVDAVRFTDWLRESGLDLRNSICMLRMNIEGSECDVIADLAERGLTGDFDGYYGLWDDMSKIDMNRDREFRRLLAARHIRPLTFNGRDMDVGLRRGCIAYDVRTSVEAALRRLERASSEQRASGRGASS